MKPFALVTIHKEKVKINSELLPDIITKQVGD